MVDAADVFLAKARESLAGAESEFRHGRYNNCANRCYYACLQGAIHALTRAGIKPRNDQWSHSFVQAQFVGQLINRRKVFPASLRDILERAFAIRVTADYEAEQVNHLRAERILRSAREFHNAIWAAQGDQR